MCIDPKGKRLPRYAVCSCGAYFPECDLEDAKVHINLKPGVANHSWTFIHKDWIKELDDRTRKEFHSDQDDARKTDQIRE